MRTAGNAFSSDSIPSGVTSVSLKVRLRRVVIFSKCFRPASVIAARAMKSRLIFVLPIDSSPMSVICGACAGISGQETTKDSSCG